MLWMARARTLAPTWNLVGPFRLSDALVDWLAAGEPFAHTVPMCDCFFAEPPAEQDGPSIHNARKVEQTDIEVFDLHADGIDFRDGIVTRCMDFSRSALRRARCTIFRNVPPLRKTRWATSCSSASTDSISFLPSIAVRRRDSSTGSRDCASSRVNVRSAIRGT